MFERTDDALQELVVSYVLLSTADDDDFVGDFTGQVYFAPGQQQVSLAVNVLDDLVPEDSEYVTVELATSSDFFIDSSAVQ